MRSKADADLVAKESQAFAGAYIPLVFDVTDALAIDKAARFVESMLDGRNLVALINNAGFYPFCDRVFC